MASNFRFYKRTILRQAFEYVRNFLAILGIMVILYFARTGSALDAVWLYLIEFPFGLIADAGRTILNYTIYGT